MVEAMFGEIRMPPWLGAIIHLAALPIVLGVIPWALSTLGVRHGWIGSSPGVWNLMGLVLVGAELSEAGRVQASQFRWERTATLTLKALTEAAGSTQ